MVSDEELAWYEWREGDTEMVDEDLDLWAETWLDKNYGGAPDECSQCFRQGKIVKMDVCHEHD